MIAERTEIARNINRKVKFTILSLDGSNRGPFDFDSCPEILVEKIDPRRPPIKCVGERR